MTWFSRKSFSSDPRQGIRAEIQVPGEAILFDGHFPDEPILPGVAQIALVMDLLAAALERPVTPQGISRVRFKKIIRPEETITVNISPKGGDESTYGFTLANGMDKVCSGTVTLADNN